MYLHDCWVSSNRVTNREVLSTTGSGTGTQTSAGGVRRTTFSGRGFFGLGGRGGRGARSGLGVGGWRIRMNTPLALSRLTLPTTAFLVIPSALPTSVAVIPLFHRATSFSVSGDILAPHQFNTRLGQHGPCDLELLQWH